MIKLRILVIDGDRAIREAIRTALAHDAFFIVRACISGREAPEAALEWRPDLILLDVAAPDLDGPSVLAQLRADRRTAPIPVLFLAAKPSLREHSALGAAGVISKPLDQDTLAATLRRFVAVEGVLAPARDNFMRRLRADATALSACRRDLTSTPAQTALMRINRIAHALAGAGGIYGFAGITSDSAALSDAAESHLAGRARPSEVARALDRLLARIGAL